MKISIREERRNPLMKRTEIVVDIEHDHAATPAKAALQQLVAKQLKKDTAHVEIRNIFSLGGKSSSYAKVFAWDEKKVGDLSAKTKEKEPGAAKEEKQEEPKEKTG